MKAASGNPSPRHLAPEPTAPDWHSLSLEEIARRLGTDLEHGLAVTDAAQRRQTFGPNALREPPPEAWWWKFLRQFQELVIWILLVAALIAAAMGDWADTAAILAIVLVNAIIGFFQEERALQALAALQRISAPVAKAVRAGELRHLPTRDLVPGDRIELDAGDHVPADARLIEAFGLRVQEAALTGESEPVEKSPAGPLPMATSLSDRLSIVHSGTVVAAGRGAAIVVATGMTTEIGRIASLLERAPAETTPLQRRLAELGRFLIVVCLGVVAVIFALEIARGGPVTEVLLRAVSLAVAAVPEGLPAVVTLVLAVGLQRMAARNALVRRLPSVETLGSVTVICSDKTGTLTRNEMTVREIVTAAGRYRVTGAGYSPHGEFRRTADGAAVAAAMQPDLERLLVIGARCNNAAVQPGDAGGWRVVGDPTEGALVVAAMKGGIPAGDSAAKVEFEIPFDSERKRMSVVVQIGRAHV